MARARRQRLCPAGFSNTAVAERRSGAGGQRRAVAAGDPVEHRLRCRQTARRRQPLPVERMCPFRQGDVRIAPVGIRRQHGLPSVEQPQPREDQRALVQTGQCRARRLRPRKEAAQAHGQVVERVGPGTKHHEVETLRPLPILCLCRDAHSVRCGDVRAGHGTDAAGKQRLSGDAVGKLQHLADQDEPQNGELGKEDQADMHGGSGSGSQKARGRAFPARFRSVRGGRRRKSMSCTRGVKEG